MEGKVCRTKGCEGGSSDGRFFLRSKRGDDD